MHVDQRNQKTKTKNLKRQKSNSLQSRIVIVDSGRLCDEMEGTGFVIDVPGDFSLV